MAIQKFEDIIAWQKAQDYVIDIYSIFGKIKDFGFKDQRLRASVSISNNIAEGFDRKSKVEFLFLFYLFLIPLFYFFLLLFFLFIQ